MPFNDETRRTGTCGRASNVSLGRDTIEIAQNPILFNQAAQIARRFVVSNTLARTIAEHPYQVGGLA